MLKEIISSEKKVINDKAVISTTISETFTAADLQHRITLITQEMTNIINQMKAWRSKYDELSSQKEELKELLSQIEQMTDFPEIPIL